MAAVTCRLLLPAGPDALSLSLSSLPLLSQISTSAPMKPSAATTASARTRTAPSDASATKATPTRRATPADVSVCNSA